MNYPLNHRWRDFCIHEAGGLICRNLSLQIILYMFEKFREKFPRLKDHFEQYAGLYTRMEIPARTVLLQEGETSKKVFLVEKGCLRACFNNNGKDVTFQFFFEGDNVSSAESFSKNIPSMFSIEAIEPSIIHVIHKKDYETMMHTLSQEPAFLNELVKILFDRQIHYMKEFLSFIRDTPTNRYLNLVKEKPLIIQRVPQHYIASYLGITSVSLSRIRNKLLKTKKIKQP
jgi:CRP-like cAMP-binding protein